MPGLYEMVVAVSSSAQGEFIKAHPYPFFILSRGSGRAVQKWIFKTQTVSVPAAKLADIANKERKAIPPELAKYEIFPVVKASDSPFARRISIGRARNNDIVFNDASVSKLHAHVEIGSNQETYITDAGSRNGTTVDGAKLPSGERRRIEVGQTIAFGRTRVTFLDAKQLYKLVAQYVV